MAGRAGLTVRERVLVDRVQGAVEIEEALYTGGPNVPRARWVQRR